MVTKKRDSKRPKFRGKNNLQRSERHGYCPEEGFDYKAVGLLKKYISETGKIDSWKRNGLTAKCQRSLTSAVKRARHMALLPFSSNHVYDTSLLSLDKEIQNDENEETISSVEDSQSNEEISDSSQDAVEDATENNEDDSNKSAESTEDSTDEDTEKTDWNHKLNLWMNLTQEKKY